jgi:hypothetical protein
MIQRTSARQSLPSHRSLLSIAVFAAFGCQQPAHDLGQTSDELAAAETPLPSVPQAQFSTDFAGTWQGDMDDALGIGNGSSPTVYTFPSGSSRLLLELTAESPLVIGTLTFGSGAPLPPPDPELGYPPDPNFKFTLGGFDAFNVPPFEGFAYKVNLSMDPGDLARYVTSGTDLFEVDSTFPAIDGKLELSFTLDEPFGAWCALQNADLCNSITGIAIADEGSTQCTAYRDDEPTTMDCQKAVLCGGEHCLGEHRTTLTLRFSPDGLTGVFNDLPLVNERGFRTRPGTVHFRRVDVDMPAVP